MEFAKLRSRIVEDGLTARSVVSQLPRIASVTITIVGCWSVLAFVDLPAAILVADAICLALVLGQAGLIAHDAGHRQLSDADAINRWMARYHWEILLGISSRWWHSKHNSHHVNPNVLGLDPDLNVEWLNLSNRDRADVSALQKWILSHQRQSFVLLLMAQAFHIRWHSTAYLFTQGRLPKASEIVFLLGHMIFVTAYPVYVLGVAGGVIFFFLLHVLLGLYLGLIFAPNHIGRAVFRIDGTPSPMSMQVLASRNIRVPHGFAWLFGGLHLQIEHHLFPTIPSYRLSEVKQHVEPACGRLQLQYCEVGPIHAFRDVLDYLDRGSHRLV